MNFVEMTSLFYFFDALNLNKFLSWHFLCFTRVKLPNCSAFTVGQNIKKKKPKIKELTPLALNAAAVTKSCLQSLQS
jgi:hypothetical protein